MSINDLLDVEIFTPELFLILFFVAVIAVPIGLLIGRRIKSDTYGDDSSNEPTEQCVATLIAKIETPHSFVQNLTVHTAVFETDDKHRIELNISDSCEFNLMMEGDRGILYYRGKRFIDFERG